jgi:hypothetical protein
MHQECFSLVSPLPCNVCQVFPNLPASMNEIKATARSAMALDGEAPVESTALPTQAQNAQN